MMERKLYRSIFHKHIGAEKHFVFAFYRQIAHVRFAFGKIKIHSKKLSSKKCFYVIIFYFY